MTATRDELLANQAKNLHKAQKLHAQGLHEQALGTTDCATAAVPVVVSTLLITAFSMHPAVAITVAAAGTSASAFKLGYGYFNYHQGKKDVALSNEMEQQALNLTQASGTLFDQPSSGGDTANTAANTAAATPTAKMG